MTALKGHCRARAVAETVTDPELPMLTLADLGVLRDVRTEDDGTVVVEITPTYSGCPAMGVMRADLLHALHAAGFRDVVVRTVLSPAWTSDWISDEGRRKLASGGIAPPADALPPAYLPTMRSHRSPKSSASSSSPVTLATRSPRPLIWP